MTLRAPLVFRYATFSFRLSRQTILLIGLPTSSVTTFLANSCGAQFHFMASRIFVLPTAHVARSLDEFAEPIRQVGIGTVYFHMVDAKLRLKTGENDVSRWLRDQGYAELADQIKRLDPCSYTREGSRRRIVALVQQHDPY